MKNKSFPKIINPLSAAYLLGILTAIAGILVLLGWLFEIEPLKTFGFGGVTMKANTSLSFLLCGLTIIFLQKSEKQMYTVIARFCSLIVALLGAIVLSEYIFNINLGVDELLFSEPKGAIDTSHPGRMSPNTALNFILFGIVLFSISFKKYERNLLLLAFYIFASTLSIISLFGYIFGFIEQTGLAYYTKMALNTSIVFILLSISIYFTMFNPSKPRLTLEYKLLSALTLSAVLLLFITFTIISSFTSFISASDLVKHSDKVKEELNNISSAAYELVACTRGYLITPHEGFLEEQNETKESILKISSKIKDLIKDNPIQVNYLAELDKLIGERISFSDSLINTKKQDGHDKAVELFATLQGKNITENIQHVISKMHAEEDRLLILRFENEKLTINNSFTIVYFNLAAKMILMALIFYFVKKDVSGRRKAEQELQKLNEELEERVKEKTEEIKSAEKRFRTLIEQGNDIIMLIDTEGKIIYASPSNKVILGYGDEDYIGTPILSYVHPDDLDQINVLYSECYNNPGKLIKAEFRHRHKDDTYRWLESFGTNHFNNPDIHAMVANSRDITDRKRTQEELEKAKLVVMNAEEVIFMTDAESKFVFINPSFTKMYGWTPEEVIGKETPGILKSGFHDLNFYNEFVKKVYQNATVSLEMVNKTKNGNLIEIKNVISPVFNKAGKIIGYVTIQSDISLKKQQEREILKAKNEAEELNKLKSYFLSNISHEFRTPLISILGFSDVLMNELENPEHIDYARYISDSGHRLQKTLSDILSLTEIEKKKIESRPQKVDLVTFINSISMVYKKSVEKKGLIFKLLQNENELWVETDTELLKNVIDNIIDNSIKFTKRGSVSIAVELKSEQGNQYAIIKITDSGIGIDQYRINAIFTPFRQESEGLSRSFEGMGLGLSVAKQLIDILHGDICLKSEVGKGTMVTIKLLALLSEKAILHKVDLRKTTITGPTKTVKASKPLLLLVEDNPGNRLLFQKYLSADFSVDIAEDGITALAMAEIKNYDVVIMDINLGPGINGVETFYRLRKLPNYKTTPVVVVTAFAMQNDRQKYLNYGFTDYMPKPVIKNEFLKRIKSYV